MNNTIKNFNYVADNFLNSNSNTCQYNLKKFNDFITNNIQINYFINNICKDIVYDFKFCFYQEASTKHLMILPPLEKEKHIKAMFDYIQEILSKHINLTEISYWYNHINDKDQSVKNFINSAFKKLIDYINEYLEIESKGIIL